MASLEYTTRSTAPGGIAKALLLAIMGVSICERLNHWLWLAENGEFFNQLKAQI